MSKPIPDDEITQISNLYQSGRSAASIGRLLNRPTNTITNWLKRLDIPMRSLSDARRKYPINQHAFSVIETEVQAYWLGFLTADCGISDTADLRVNLQKRDVVHLERLRDFLGTSTPIRCADKYVYLDLRSRHLCQDLARYGVGPRKSKTVRWPIHLRASLHHHYVRGVFDGDGTWCTGGEQWRLIGNRSFLFDVQTVMMSACCLRKTALIAHHTTAEIAYLIYNGKRQVHRIVCWMYKDATVFLERKQTAYAYHTMLHL